MSDVVVGETSSLKASQAKALERLAQRSIGPERIVGAALARDLVDLSRELNRRLGLFVDRRGRIERVIVGDAHSLQLPEFTRVRGVDGRLRGIRLVVSHLLPDPLDREELADLAKLRLDLVAAVHHGSSGLQVDLAALAPGRDGDAFTVRTWPRTPLALLDREDPTARVREDLPVPFDSWIRSAEAALVDATKASRAAAAPNRALALVVHDGSPGLHARTAELRELCRTAGITLVDIVTQRRPHPDPRTFFGEGKLREVLVRALEQDCELLICDPDLTPSQAKNVGDMTDLKVIDRTMLILDIFAQHAKSSDGKLQVELAQLRYRLPRMVGKGTMMSRLMGGIGGRGPGETKLEIDRRRAQERINDLERRLKTMRKQRDQRRSARRKANVPVVAIVGYTNAGKSTLLNTVTDSDVVAENLLFATLDPTVRRLRFPMEREIVLLDTVGFIRDLPPALMQAFSATLEEIADADLILHVVDATDPDNEQQIATVEGILKELEALDVPRLVVFNKCDALPPGETPPVEDAATTTSGRPTRFWISALDRRTTRPLIDAIESRLWAPDLGDMTRSPDEGTPEGNDGDDRLDGDGAHDPHDADDGHADDDAE